MKKKLVKTLWLFEGYVEDQSNSCCLLTHSIGFVSVSDAMENLASIFGNIERDSLNVCCRDAIAANEVLVKKARFCAECGAQLEGQIADIGVQIESSVQDFLRADIDTSASLHEDLYNNGWKMDIETVDIKGSYMIFRAPGTLGAVLTGEEFNDCMVVKVGR